MPSPATCAASATPSPPAASGLARWKENMAFLRSFYVADDIWRFA